LNAKLEQRDVMVRRKNKKVAISVFDLMVGGTKRVVISV